MADVLGHERLYRTEQEMQMLRTSRICVCGIGAIGSNLVDALTRMGAANVQVIDDDKVEAHNVGTQIYTTRDVGARKVDALAAHVYDATREGLLTFAQRLTADNVRKALRGQAMVIDCFDNGLSRGVVAKYCSNFSIACLHVGLNGGYGAVRWNEGYIVPQSDDGLQGCDYAMARPLVLMLAALAAEEVITSLLGYGRRRNLEFTLRDLKLSWRGA